MFSDEVIGLHIGHQRELRHMASQAQAVVDDMDRDIWSLRRQLAAARRSNHDLQLERGRRNNERLLARMSTKH